jgi:hypothetical protein
MERLTERYDITPDGESDVWVKQHDYISAARKLCDYEDSEEQGLLVRLPVSIGTKVYMIASMFDCIYDYDNCKATQKWKCEEDIQCEYERKSYYVKEIEFTSIMKNSIGKSIFLTREEAEKRLEEMKND